MNPKLEELDVRFSTADLRSFSVVHHDRSITLVLVDFSGAETTIIFTGVAAYKWDESSFEQFDASPDRVYRANGSDWLAHWSQGPHYSHYVLGLLGLAPAPTGYLEVIALSMEHKNA